MVIPVGAPSDVQHLLLVGETNPTAARRRGAALPVRFVPLTWIGDEQYARRSWQSSGMRHG